jgi:hypothetical protein
MDRRLPLDIRNDPEQPSRDPPRAIAAALRREVNFGCPVRFANGEGCGSPVLTYHHFDPPWAENHQHNPDGMIALCPEHHDRADGGNWTRQQLREFKKHPYVDDVVKCRWPWTAEKLVMQFGPNLTIGQGSPLWLDEKPVLGFRPQPNPNLGNEVIIFDSFIEDRAGNPWMKIEEGSFSLEAGPTNDLIFRPRTAALDARHKDGTSLQVRYRRVPLSRFEEWWKSFNHDKRWNRDNRYDTPSKFLTKFDVLDSDNSVPTVSVMGQFVTGHARVQITKRKMTFQCLLPGYTGREGYVDTAPGMIFNMTESVRFVDHTQREWLRIG